MDATTVIAVISCAIVFYGWLVLPHSATVKPVVVSDLVSEERKPVSVSAESTARPIALRRSRS